MVAVEPWNVPGRYGWVGGTGTAAYVVPAAPGRGATSYVLLTQRTMQGPDDQVLLGDLCTFAALRTG